MSTSSWSDVRALATRRLIGTCPRLAELDTACFQPSITTLALATVELATFVLPMRLEVEILARPAPDGDIEAQAILRRIADLVSDHVLKITPDSNIDLGAWLAERGFTTLMAGLLKRGTDPVEVSSFAELHAEGIRSLSQRVAALCQGHLAHILARDLPAAVFLRHRLTPAAQWLLVPESSGQEHRSELLKRRQQALQAYGALACTLREADVCRVIDAGEPLAPVLMERHGLTSDQLRALLGARGARASIAEWHDLGAAVEELLAHEVPLPQWPGAGRPNRDAAWSGSIWLKARNDLIRPDYLDVDGHAVQDAMNALRDDLLRPLIAARAAAANISALSSVTAFLREASLKGDRNRHVRRCFLAAMRAAIIGPRGPKSFQEAVAVWHRRAASIAALRHERTAERPGWPRLCEPWRSEDGRHEMVVLASAADLVEEGNLLNHCVGSYYDICRRDDTQILSLREDRRRVATIEVKLVGEGESFGLSVGQFQSCGNTPPAAHLHDVLRFFLRAVRSGSHPLNAARIAHYRKRMRNVWDGSGRYEALPLGHAREVFPLYCPLLPRDTPADFDDWCRQTGLIDAVDEALTHLAS